MGAGFFKKYEIVSKIRSLHEVGAPLNISAVKRSEPDLLFSAYAEEPFLGWKGALQLAGISYDDIAVELLETVPCELCGGNFANVGNHVRLKHGWTVDLYLTKYPGAELASEKNRANRTRMENEVFPHWEPFWTPEYILDRLFAMNEAGIPMHFATVAQVDGALTNALTDYREELGSWHDVLGHLGLEAVRGTPQWKSTKLTRAFRKSSLVGTYPGVVNVKNAIRKRDEEKQTLHSSGVQKGPDADKRLFNAACRYFGNWETALSEAGLNAEEIVRCRVRFMTKEAVVSEIQRRHRNGQALNSAAATQYDVGMVHAGKRLFGSWDEALASAGLDPLVVRKRVPKYESRDAVADEIARRKSEGLSLRPVDLRTEDTALYRKAGMHFGSWADALEAAGIDRATVMRKPPSQKI